MIEAKHIADFDALTGGAYTNFALFECTVNGEQAAAIVSVTQNESTGLIHVTPLFVSVTPGMVLRDPDGNSTVPPKPGGEPHFRDGGSRQNVGFV